MAKARGETERLICVCGGLIHMRTIAPKGAMKHFAECEKCKKIARRPKELMK